MEVIRGTLHPLQIPIILKSIFGNLDVDDLKACRQVCTTWRGETAKAMRSIVKVNIDLSREEEVQTFHEVVGKNESTFFQNPFVDTFILRKSKDVESSEFWKVCGTYVKSLHLKRVTFLSVEAFRRFVFQSCSNLKNLKIEKVRMDGNSTEESKMWVAPQFSQNTSLNSLSFARINDEFNVGWVELLSHFPYLEELNFHSYSPKQYDDVFGALEIIRNNNANYWKLQRVNLKSRHPKMPFPASFTRAFCDGRLTSLVIHVNAITTHKDVSNIQKVLTANAISLKKFQLTTESNHHFDKVIFPLPGNPIFKSIQKLHLDTSVFTSTSILQSFPNVKKLTLELDEMPEIINAHHKTLSKCTEFTLCNRMVGTADLFELFCLMPNVKKLKVTSYNTQMFSLISKSWPDMTCFEVFTWFGAELDHIFHSSSDRKDARKVNKEGRKGSWQLIPVHPERKEFLWCFLQCLNTWVFRAFATPTFVDDA